MAKNTRLAEDFNGVSAADPNADTIVDGKPAGAKTITLDVRNRTGADQQIEQIGQCAYIRTGHEPLVLHPGLNALAPDVWEAYKAHPPIAAMLAEDRASVVDLARMSRPMIAALAKRTRQAEALGLLHTLESTRPVVGGRAERRDQGLVEEIERRLRRAQHNPGINLADMQTAAQARAAVMRP